jgi:acyl-CoA thioester hydrolase
MHAKPDKVPPGVRGDYRHFLDIPTRWADNDIYGHSNNAVYYAYFDTIVNRFLIDAGRLDIHHGPVIGIMAETGCKYFRSFSYPEMVTAAMRVSHLGRSSVRYDTALFGIDDAPARAEGFLVHVFVNRATNSPVEIPSQIRAALEAIKT